MRKTSIVASFALSVSLFLAACGGNQAYEPTKINPETDICKTCNMSIADEKFAGQIALSNGDYEVFDDLGCLMEYMENMDKDDLGEAFIKDESGEKWLNVEESAFVHDENIWTPMSYGVVAFESEEAAKQFVETKGSGEVLAYADLSSFDWGAH